MSSQNAVAQTLRDVVKTAIIDGPSLREAASNRDAIAQELHQASGRYLPTVDISVQGGPRYLRQDENAAGSDSSSSYTSRSANLALTQLLYDGRETDNEIDRQSFRLSSANYRLLDRQQDVALNVAESYLEILRLEDVIVLLTLEVGALRQIEEVTKERVPVGEASQTDIVQALERISRAENRLIQRRQDLVVAQNALKNLVGRSVTNLEMPMPGDNIIPGSLDQTLEIAMRRNMERLALQSDVGAADAVRRSAEGTLYPRVALEGDVVRSETGVSSASDNTNASLLLVARWNLYRGGIDSAQIDEQAARARETRARLDTNSRDLERFVRDSWDRRKFSRQINQKFLSQIELSQQVLESYEAQFAIGERDILDVLDATNDLYNAEIDERTSFYSELVNTYRLHGAMSALLQHFNLDQLQGVEISAR